MNSNLQNKLSQFEATPPGKMWDKIAGALDAEESYPQRLYRFEQQPPIAIWTKIEDSLDKESVPAKVIPFTTRFKKPIRYITAASFIAAILVVATLIMNRSEAVSAKADIRGAIPMVKPPISQPEKVIVAEANSPQEKFIVPDPPIITVKTANTFPSIKKEGVVSLQNLLTPVAVAGEFIPENAAKNELVDFASSTNYMVYSDANGHVMKLSKKLFSLVHCEQGDGSCQDRIHQLQQKLSSDAITADFIGLVEMLRQLQ